MSNKLVALFLKVTILINMSYKVQREFKRTFGDPSLRRWTKMKIVNNFAKSEEPYHQDPFVWTQETIAAVADAIQGNLSVSKNTPSAEISIHCI